MGRKYAGILGPIAFTAVVARNIAASGEADSALVVACVALFAFSAIGYLVGSIAERTVVEAIQATMHAKWPDRDAAGRAASKPYSQSAVSDKAA
jgi:hypothetical protein